MEKTKIVFATVLIVLIIVAPIYMVRHKIDQTASNIDISIDASASAKVYRNSTSEFSLKVRWLEFIHKKEK